MNDYLISYIDINGRVKKRSSSQRIRVVIFASFKFAFDRIVSLIGLIVALPIMLIIAIAIKLDSKGPVLFRQQRTGKGGKLFTMYKFRTMVASNDVHDFKKADEHTKVGKFLRTTSLDEIPQLISIFKGDMSFIGPRPWIHDYYLNMNDVQRVRNAVRPGLTGLAQVKGRNKLTIFEKIDYDLTYVKNYSLKQDIRIVFLTIKEVFLRTGVDAGKGGIKKDIDDLKDRNNI